MRCSRIRLLWLVALLWAVPACLWAANPPKTIWATYHGDMLRRGLNPSAVDITNPASLNLIWVFPRATEDAVQEEYKYIVDNRNPLFFGAGAWNADADPEALGYITAAGAQESEPYSYLWAWTANATEANGGDPQLKIRSGTLTRAKVTWRFPTAVPRGLYQVWIWVPPLPPVDVNVPDSPGFTYTKQAVYHVFDANGESTVVFDQTKGGTWQPLSMKPFSFTGSSDLRVELDNKTADPTSNVVYEDGSISGKTYKIRVAADAIRFDPVTGQEIYSSPTSAEVDFKYPLKTGHTWEGRIPVVFTGTVEQPFGGAGSSPDMGAVYCINSITPDDQAFDSDDDHKELSELLGKPLWRYPRDMESMNSAEVTKFLAEPYANLEGPIEGGIFSSPTLAHVNIPRDTEPDTFMCIVTGMDRQVYGLDARTGKLLWKGPGVTVSEDNDKWNPSDATGKLRNDAFGGQYQWEECGKGGSMEWSFSGLIDRTGLTDGDGRSYTVYAWIPTRKGDETAGHGRIADAEYTVTYYNGQTTTVKINQSTAANQGRWVSLGSYFGVSKVNLSTQTSYDNPSTHCVVADAMMIVPDTIGAFSYCSATTDVPLELKEYNDAGKDHNADHAFACTATEGRLMSFDLKASLANADSKYPIGRVDWVYPAIRNKYNIPTTGDGGNQPSLGQVGATPTYYKGEKPWLYLPTLNGTIHCLNPDRGELLGDFTATTTSSGDGSIEEPDPGIVNNPGFTSSINVGQTGSGADVLMIGSVDGAFYALDPKPVGGKLQLLKKVTNGTLPFGAFRYSTPSLVAPSNQKARVWAPSTDGHIYAMKASDSGSGDFMQLLTKDNYPGFDEPSVMAAIQGSPAFDGPKSAFNNARTMYVGDMNGVLHWFNAETGLSDWTFDPGLLDPTDTGGADYFTGYQCDGALFSSPNVTDVDVKVKDTGKVNYVYVGGADGRIYAFSQYGNAWGGMWAGGHWPFRHGHPNRIRENSTTRLSPDTDVQVDLFNLDFYDKSVAKNPHETDTAVTKTTSTTIYLMDKPNWGTDWIVSPEMKLAKGLTGKKNTEIDTYLTDEARKRREATNAIFPDLNQRSSNTLPIYFEWGETINVVLWNLPALEFMSGQSVQSAANSIVFSLANTSPGASAGSLIRQSGRVTLKEYIVLDESKPTSGQNAAGKAISGFEPLLYEHGTKVKRCCAMAQIYLDPKRNPCFSPGPGWTLVVEVKRKRTNDPQDALITQRIPIAQLVPKSGVHMPDFDQEQLFGINNPLAIRDDQDAINAGYFTEVAWPSAFKVSAGVGRADDEAHFNGNAALTTGNDGEPVYGVGKVPLTNLQFVNHGSSSREARVGIADRSATGSKIVSMLANVPQTAKIENFRIDNGDLRWQGGPAQIGASGGVWFPWEYGPGSVDYPNIYRQRQEVRKASDDGLPTEARTTLPSIVGGILAGKTIGRYEDSIIQPETVFLSVDVPRFQPANYKAPLSPDKGPMERDYNGAGYQRTFVAYVDSNGDGNVDRGDTVVGRPSVSQEVYRLFKVALMVPSDPKIEVEESLVDVGRAPHGLGEGMVGLQGFSAYNPDPSIAQWFKPITIKNAGNVNLPKMTVGRNIKLFSDQSSPVAPIQEGEITSSLDWVDSFFTDFKSNPFETSANNIDYGYTLTKARVGDPDPTEMTIPDKRKWDVDYNGTRMAAQQIWAQVTGAVLGASNAQNLDKPLPVKVSVKVPLTQPIGTYQSMDTAYGLPYVPVFSDLDGNGVLSGGVEPVAQKSFQLKVTVRETQMTGGITPTSLAQVDYPNAPKFGDATPAAYRDPLTRKVFLVWSSNRVVAPDQVAGLKPEDWANAPWLLSYATLNWDTGWKPTAESQHRWWLTQPWASNSPAPYLPTFGWPDTLLGSYADWQVMPWGGDSTIPSVRHHSPVFAQYGPNDKFAWLAWVGTADIFDPVTKKIAQENRIFYTDASNCSVVGDSTGVYAIEHSPAMVKRYPSMAIDESASRMWMFWQGGDEGRWGIYCSANDTPADKSAWTPDMKLLMADSLTSVSSPNALLRSLWTSNSGGPAKLFDVVYSGSTKLGQTSDIMMNRYAAKVDKDVADNLKGELPNAKAQPLPRIFGERLERDSRNGYYTARHLAWVKPSGADGAVADNWGGYIIGSDTADMPYVHVFLPTGYPIPGTTDQFTTSDIEISCTNGIKPEIDEASGLYIYRYPAGSDAAKFLGETVVDYSSGVVRFKEQLAERRAGDKFISASVFADYTPRTWRLTTDKAVDNSPRAFIEKTNMSCHTTVDPTKYYDANPGLGPDWRTPDGRPNGSQPVDRMWVFWRKAATGAQSSTIYFSTYRVGVELSDLFRRNNKAMDPNARYRITGVEGALGPWEIDGSGGKVYFTQMDERYRSLKNKKIASPFYSGMPGAIKIYYEEKTATNTNTSSLMADDVFWQPELPEQSLLGFSSDGNVNEGSIYAFADPVFEQSASGTFVPAFSSKIWLFWTSTRAGTTDLFWETLSPEFVAR